MQWKFFSDEMPKSDELIVFTYHATGAADGNEVGDCGPSEAEWFHIDIGLVSEMGFGHVLYRNGGSDQMSGREHEDVLMSGRWVYVWDIASEGFDTTRPIVPHCRAIVVEKSKNAVLWRK